MHSGSQGVLGSGLLTPAHRLGNGPMSMQRARLQQTRGLEFRVVV